MHRLRARPRRAAPRTAPLHLKAFSTMFMESPNPVNLEGGDRIILHQDVLNAILSSNPRAMESPLLFRITNKALRRVTHCGVLEFSAFLPHAFLPQWMMEGLALNDGDEVTLHQRELPDLKRVTFQPAEYAFTRLPTPKATLEFALRSFSTLTRGEVIPVTHGTHTYHLKVQELSPGIGDPPAVSLISSGELQVEVAFEPPKEKPPEEDAIAPPMAINSSTMGTAKRDKYAYFRVKVVDGGAPLHIVIKLTSGDSVIVVSTTTPHPTTAARTWRSTSTSLLISPLDPKFKVGWYYIGVQGYKSDVEFELTVSEGKRGEDMVDSTSSQGQATGSANASPGAKQCDNCKAFVPPNRYMIHSAQCARKNWRCDICEKVLPRSVQATHRHCVIEGCQEVVAPEEMEKHMDVAHTRATCACELEVDAGELDHHRTHLCRLRLLECKTCHMRVEAQGLHDHEAYCAAKSIPCDLCGREVSAKKMDRHKAAEHGINPCLPANKQKRTDRLNDPPPKTQRNMTAGPGRSHLGFAQRPIPGSGPGNDPLAQALAASRQSAGIPLLRTPSDSGSDLALQQALMASMGQPSAMTSPPMRASAQSQPPARVRCVYCEQMVASTAAHQSECLVLRSLS